MRFDDVGMFWEDTQSGGTKAKYLRPMPPIPDTGWRPPISFPNLREARCISIDCETYDPDLLTYGPGWARGRGHLVGVSIGTPDGGRWYFPMRHEVEAEDNMPPESVLEWLRSTLGDASQPKVGANLLYDIGWLRQEGVVVKGELVDVQFAEALLDESAHVNLETLGQKYLGIGKESSILYDWCSRFYTGKAESAQRANIYRAPPRLVGPYAESDADLPLRVASRVYPLLAKEGMIDLFRMECHLIYLLVDMRFAGVQVDLGKAEEVRKALKAKEADIQNQLNYLSGFQVNTNASSDIAKVFDKLGLSYKLTAKGSPSFTGKFLETVNHPIGECIRELRKVEKLRSTFVESYILNSHVKGRVHCEFHPLRGEGSGTRSGRLSSSNPNLQNIPARDSDLAPLVRGLFIPNHGHKQWVKYDYSQIEYRFLIHYAMGEGSEEAREHFNACPETDYHDMALRLVAPRAGWDISTKELFKAWRKPVKNINFGLIYGMGVKRLALDLGLSSLEGKQLFQAYHEGVPFAKATMNHYMDMASKSGVITTILGRKSRFDFWEPMNWSKDTIALPFQEAVIRYGHVRRAHTHKALNRLLQGSAADMMKMAMYKCYVDGVFAETGTPLLTVHDELDFSDAGGKEEAFRHMKHVMENVIKLKIPIKAEAETGPDWGHVK